MAQSKSKAPAVEPSAGVARETPEQIDRKGAFALGTYLVVLAALCGSGLLSIWGALQPPAGAGAAGAAAASDGFASGWHPDVRLFVAAILAGTMGSLLHAIQSFTKYVAHGRLYRRWLAWYVLRPFIGGILASMLFLIIRGGLMTNGSDAVSLNGLIALAGVGGMFSEPATKRLSEVANSVFGTTKDPEDGLSERTDRTGGGSAT